MWDIRDHLIEVHEHTGTKNVQSCDPNGSSVMGSASVPHCTNAAGASGSVCLGSQTAEAWQVAAAKFLCSIWHTRRTLHAVHCTFAPHARIHGGPHCPASASSIPHLKVVEILHRDHSIHQWLELSTRQQLHGYHVHEPQRDHHQQLQVPQGQAGHWMPHTRTERIWKEKRRGTPVLL